MTDQVVFRTDVKLCDDDLTEEAKARFTYHSEITNAYQINARNVLANERLTPIGRHLFCIRLEQNYERCKSVLNYEADRLKNQSSSPSSPIRPLIICGLPRTGSTLLYNLLACDPTCRAPLLLDMMQPVPPIARSNRAEQTQSDSNLPVINTSFKSPELDDFERQFYASHPKFSHEEDLFILFQAGLNFFNPLLVSHDNTELMTWYFDETNKDFAYEYHKTFLQMLNSVDAPQSHWLLKSPIHTYFLDTLVRYYPSASIIMTHRQLDELFPSWNRLCSTFTNFHLSADNDSVHMGDVKKASLMLDVMIDRLLKFRRSQQKIKILDIVYDDLVAQPIETVRHIYNYFELPWSEQFESAMVNWLRENPQGKQGRNSYSLDEIGLTASAIEQRYEEYNNMFLKR